MRSWAVWFEGPLPFAETALLQERLAEARAADRLPDVVLFLEHKPVVTLGTRGRTASLVASPERLAAMGVDLVQASRGGDATFHGPGQLVIYPILKLGAHEADAHGYLANLEEVAIRTAADFGVRAFRRSGKNGAWTDAGKIAAIGFRLKRWVTLHGMSFNVSVDLKGFDSIIPCGLKGERVSSLKALLGPACPALAEVRQGMIGHFEKVFERPLRVFAPGDALPAELNALSPKS